MSVKRDKPLKEAPFKGRPQSAKRTAQAPGELAIQGTELHIHDEPPGMTA